MSFTRLMVILGVTAGVVLGSVSTLDLHDFSVGASEAQAQAQAQARAQGGESRNRFWYRSYSCDAPPGSVAREWVELGPDRQQLELELGESRVTIAKIGRHQAVLMHQHAGGATSTGIACNHERTPDRAALMISRAVPILSPGNCVRMVGVYCGDNPPRAEE